MTEETGSSPTPVALPAPGSTPEPSGPHRERAVLDHSPPMRPRTHLRAVAVVMVLGILILGLAYPFVVTEIAQVVNPSGANGSLIYQNGTLVGSTWVGQNLSLPYLFWDRVSTTDYNTTAGYNASYGPTDPALLNWLNETIAYLRADWNLTLNESLPLDLVAPSYSNFDPFLVPAGVLIQVPRVAGAMANITHLPFDTVVADLTSMVNSQIQNPWLGIVGTPVVNVVSLDVQLLDWSGLEG